MRIRIAIAEDEKMSREAMSGFLERYGRERGVDVAVTSFADGMDLCEEYSPAWDLLILDIQMRHMDGMAAARRIRTVDPNVLILFTTSLARYAVQSYEVDAMGYLLKPISYESLAPKLDKAISLLRRNGKTILLSTKDGVVRVALDEVLFFEVQNHDLRVVTTGRDYVLRMSLGEMEKRLAADGFALCNQCYLVNLKNVTQMRKDTVLVGTHELAVSRAKKKPFWEAFSAYLGEAL